MLTTGPAILCRAAREAVAGRDVVEHDAEVGDGAGSPHAERALQRRVEKRLRLCRELVAARPGGERQIDAGEVVGVRAAREHGIDVQRIEIAGQARESLAFVEGEARMQAAGDRA